MDNDDLIFDMLDLEQLGQRKFEEILKCFNFLWDVQGGSEKGKLGKSY